MHGLEIWFIFAMVSGVTGFSVLTVMSLCEKSAIK